MTTPLLKKTSAFLPVLMSLLALSLVLGHIALVGTARQEDEGTAAHLWQLLMVLQLPIIAFFALRWLPERPKQALLILTLQFVAAVAAAAPVFYYEF